MKRTLRFIAYLAALLALAPTLSAQNTLQSKPTVTVPAGDDWLYVQGATNNVRKLSPTYYLPAATAATTYQPLDSDLTSIAALTTTAYGRSFLSTADAAAARIILGLGTAATADSSAFAAASHTHAIADITSLQAALDAKAALSAIAATNASGVNTDGLVSWSQLIDVPAGFADGSDDGSGGGSGTVTSFSAGDLAPLFTTTETNATSTPALSFALSSAAQNAVLAGPTSGTGAPTYRALVDADIPAAIARDSEVTAAVSAVTPASLGLVIGTNVQAYDADLADLADGSLSGSKVGSGIDAANVTTGTLPLARLSGITNTEIASGAAIALSKLATDPLARANHTGTQAISTVTNLQSSLDAKQATLVSASNIKTVNGSSILGSGDLTIATGGGSITSTWSTATTNVHWEGDSLTAYSIADASEYWPEKLRAIWGTIANYSDSAVSGAVIGNPANPSEVSNSLYNRYATYVYPKRPAANGGTAGITHAELFVWIGTNDIMTLSSATIISRLTSYWAMARADGFKLCVVTLYRDERFDTDAQNNLIWGQRMREVNKFIRESPHLYDRIIDAEEVFRDRSSNYIQSDGLHITETGHLAFARYIAGKYRAPSIDPLPPGRERGTSPGSLMTPEIYSRNQIASNTAKPINLQASSSGAGNILWNLDQKPHLKIVASGDIDDISAQGGVEGGVYRLSLTAGAHPVTFSPQSFDFPGGEPTWTTTGDRDHAVFFFEDGRLHLVNHKLGLDPVVPPPPGVLLLEEGTNATGNIQYVHATAPTTYNVPGNNWQTNGFHDPLALVGIKRTTTNTLKMNQGFTRYDLDRSDNYALSTTIVTKPTGSDPAFIVLRAGTYGENDACIGFQLTTAYNQLMFVTYPNGFKGSGATTNWSGSLSSYTEPFILKISVEGTSVKAFVNGTQVGSTVTTSVGQTNEYISFYGRDTNFEFDDVKVEDLTP